MMMAKKNLINTFFGSPHTPFEKRTTELLSPHQTPPQNIIFYVCDIFFVSKCDTKNKILILS